MVGIQSYRMERTSNKDKVGHQSDDKYLLHLPLIRECQVLHPNESRMLEKSVSTVFQTLARRNMFFKRLIFCKKLLEVCTCFPGQHMGHPQTASPSFKGKKAKSTLSGLVSILQNDERFQVFYFIFVLACF